MYFSTITEKMTRPIHRGCDIIGPLGVAQNKESTLFRKMQKLALRERGIKLNMAVLR